MPKTHRIRKDPATKIKEGWHVFRVYDEGGQELRVDAIDEDEAMQLAKAWPRWTGKIIVEKARH